MKIERLNDCDVTVDDETYCTGQFSNYMEAALYYHAEAKRLLALAEFLEIEAMS